MRPTDPHPAQRWDTLRTGPSVLAVARTLTSATRLLDVLPLLGPGADVSFTINPGSVFADGLPEYLASLGAAVLSWEEATSRRFDLALSAAVHAGMRHIDAPLLVMPHGAGYNRLVPASTGDGLTPAGLSRRELTHEGRVVPSVIGLSHEEQVERLRESCPEAVRHAVVVGDPAFDRLTRSLPRRERYRRLLGAGRGRRLVVANSTWNVHSLLGSHPELPYRLVTELPADEFAVALVLHPNIWARHSPLNVLRDLTPAMAAGLRVIPPREGWRAALIAADWVVGDHGSVSFYGAGLDRVTLLAATGEDELDPRSPTAELGRVAPRLDPAGDLRGQLLEAAAEHRSGTLRRVTERTLGRPGRSAQLLRDRLYGCMGLSRPDGPPEVAPVPDPVPVAADRPTTYDVVAEVDGGAVRVARYPVVAGHRGARGVYAVTADEVDRRWPQSAEVMARTDPEAEPDARIWAERQASELPGLNVVAAALGEGRHLVRLPDGALLEARTERPWGGRRPELDPVLVGAAVNAWLVSGRTAEALRGGLAVRTGSHEVPLRVEFEADAARKGTASPRDGR